MFNHLNLMKFNHKVNHQTIDEIIIERKKIIQSIYNEEFKRNLYLIKLISLFADPLKSVIDKEDRPFDIILVNFLNNLYHLFAVGSNIYSGIPYQGNMLMRTILETIVADMRLIASYEKGDLDSMYMHEWTTTKNEPESEDRFDTTWKFKLSREFLFGDNLDSNNFMKKLYSELSEMIHGNPRLAFSNVQLFDPGLMMRSFNLLYNLSMQVFMVVIYAVRDFLPIEENYQKYVFEFINYYGWPSNRSNIFTTSKLPDLNYEWLKENLNKQ